MLFKRKISCSSLNTWAVTENKSTCHHCEKFFLACLDENYSQKPSLFYLQDPSYSYLQNHDWITSQKSKNSGCFYFLTLQSFNCSNLFYPCIKITYIAYFILLVIYVCVHAHAQVCTLACKWLQRPEEGARSPGAEVTGCNDPPDLDPGNRLLSSERAAHALKCWTICPLPTGYFNPTIITELTFWK